MVRCSSATGVAGSVGWVGACVAAGPRPPRVRAGRGSGGAGGPDSRRLSRDPGCGAGTRPGMAPGDPTGAAVRRGGDGGGWCKAGVAQWPSMPLILTPHLEWLYRLHD